METFYTPNGKGRIPSSEGWGGNEYPMTRVVMMDADDTRFDLGDILLPMVVFPHKRNRIINNFNEEARKAWLAEIAQE